MMAREIKFRAKVKYPDDYHGKRDIAEGEWISGDLHLRCRFPHIHTDIFNSYPIDVETIGQFVGMIYPDGTPVYEGDIVTGKCVLIGIDTGEVHRIDLKPATLHDIQIHSEQPAIGNDWSVEFKCVKPLSKRKSRKFRYFIERLCKPRDRKYIPKREFIDMIFRQYVDTGDFNARLPREEYMKYSKRELRIMNNGLFIYTLIHSGFNTPPDPEGHKGDEYFGDPMKKIVKLPQGFEKGGACHA